MWKVNETHIEYIPTYYQLFFSDRFLILKHHGCVFHLFHGVFTLQSLLYATSRCDVNCLQKRSSTAQSIALISYFDFLPSASPVRLRSLITVLCLFAPSPSASTEARTVVTNYCCRAIHPAGTVDGEQKMRTQNTFNRLRIVNSRVLLRFEPAAGCCG